MPTTLTDTAPAATVFEYEPTNPYLVRRITDPDGVEQRTWWDLTNRRPQAVGTGKTATDTYASITYIGYDRFGRRSVVRSPADAGRWIETWTTYTADGQPSTVTGPGYTTVNRSCGVDTDTALGCMNTAVLGAQDLTGPVSVTTSTYRLDGTLTEQKVADLANQPATARTTDYTDAWVTSAGGPCSPMTRADCVRQTTTTEPPHVVATNGATTRRITTQRFDSAGRLDWSQVSDTAGVSAPSRTTTTYQAALGRIASTSTQLGVKTWYGYDSTGQLTSTTVGPNGSDANHTTKTFYDRRGRVTFKVGPAGDLDETGATAQSCVGYTYDQADRVVQTTTGVPNNAANPTACIAAGSTKRLSTRTTYDQAGRPRYQVVDVDDDGVFTDPTCPASGGVVDTADAVTETTYTPGGRTKTTVKTYANLTTANWCTVAKDTTTNNYRLTPASGKPADGRLDTIKYPTPVWPIMGLADRQYTYDLAGRVTQDLQDGGWGATSFTKTGYTAAGQPQTVTRRNPTIGQPDVTAVTCYDAFGEVVYTSDAHVLTVPLTSPCNSNGTPVDNYQGIVNTYNPDGSLKTVRSALATQLADPSYAETAYFYDGRGNRTQRRSWTRDNPTATYEQVTESWTYNDDDQQLTATPPTGGATTFGYNAFGQISTVTQPSGRLETRSYRNDGQLSQRQFTQTGADTITWGYRYDAAGRRTQATDTTGTGPTYTSTWTLDRLGRIVTQSTPNRGANPVNYSTVTSTFDLAGNRWELQHPDGTKYRYNHDSYGRIIGTSVYIGQNCCVALAVYNYTYSGGDRAEDWIGGTSSQYRRWVYNLGSDGVTPNAFDETITDTPANRTRYSTMTWRPDGRLAAENNTTNGGAPQTVNYSYDKAGQLTCAATAASCPTPPGTPPSTDTCAATTTGTYLYTYNARGMRMCSASGATVTSYSYDDNAQLQTATSTDANQSYGYTWDPDGRRTGSNRNNGATNVTTTYDTAGNPRLVSTSLSGTPWVNETRTYNAGDQLVRLDFNGAVSNDYTWSDMPDPTGVPQIIEARQNGVTTLRVNYGKSRLSTYAPGDPAPKYLFYDQRYSVLPTSAYAAPDNYEPYGKATGTSPGYSYLGYRSEVLLGDTIHLRNREYDPVSGTFTSRDPLDGVDGTTTVANSYHYTSNDPINRQDPTGQRPCDAGLGKPEAPSNANDLRYDAEERPDPIPGAKSLRDAIGNDRCLLFYNGVDELAAVVVGNLSARHVMIELAATNTKLENFAFGNDLLGRATNIQGGAGDFAVIAYLGYKTPGGRLGPENAATYPFPEEARNRLADLVHALKDRGKHVSMLAHSWSAQVALRYDTQNAKNVDDLVLVGAFATSETNAGDFPSNREWQGYNDDDWILTGHLGDWSPGTRRFSTEGSVGHDYFTGRAANNIRAIGRADWHFPGLCRSGDDNCTWGLP